MTVVLPVCISAPAGLPGLVKLEPVGEGEALALTPPVVQAPPGVPVGAHDHLAPRALRRHRHAQPLVGPDLVIAGLAAGARHDPSDGLAVRGALGERTVPHAARPETDNKSARVQSSGGIVFITQNIRNLAELASC